MARQSDDDFWQPSAIEWTRPLSDPEREQLRRRSRATSHAPGELIFSPTPGPRSVYLLERGLVRIHRLSSEGGDVTLGYVRPGEVFGELSLFTAGGRESFAQAVRASHAWRIPISEMRAVVARHPEVGLAITAQIGHRFRRIESRVENLVFRGLRARLVQALLELAEDLGRDATGGGRTIDVPLSQRDLAALVGATRQSVSGCLRALRDDALLDYRGRSITLRDLPALRAIAQG